MLSVRASKAYDGSVPFEEYLRANERTPSEADPFIRNAYTRCVRVTAITNQGAVTSSGVIFETGLVVTSAHLDHNAKRLYKVLINDHEAEALPCHMKFSTHYDLQAWRVKTRRLTPIRFEFSRVKGRPVFYVGNPEFFNRELLKGEVTGFNKYEIRASTLTGLGMSGCAMYDAHTGGLLGIITKEQGSNYNFTTALRATHVERFYLEAQEYMQQHPASDVQEPVLNPVQLKLI